MTAVFRRLIACLLIVSVPAQAGLVSTESVAAAGSRERVTAFLERADVQRQLEALGVAPGDVKARVDAMSDTEVANLAGKIDNAPAGGMHLGPILALALIVIIIIVITDTLGYTKIFSSFSR